MVTPNQFGNVSEAETLLNYYDAKVEELEARVEIGKLSGRLDLDGYAAEFDMAALSRHADAAISASFLLGMMYAFGLLEA